jgi:hypothetical protein
MTYVPTLVHLPGTRLSPEVVLHRTLDKLGHIDGVVGITWRDGTTDIDWSQMKLSDLSFMLHSLERFLFDEIRRVEGD